MNLCVSQGSLQDSSYKTKIEETEQVTNFPEETEQVTNVPEETELVTNVPDSSDGTKRVNSPGKDIAALASIVDPVSLPPDLRDTLPALASIVDPVDQFEDGPMTIIHLPTVGPTIIYANLNHLNHKPDSDPNRRMSSSLSHRSKGTIHQISLSNLALSQPQPLHYLAP